MRNIIITGADSGLGYETAKKIAKKEKDCRIILACRNDEKAQAAKSSITAESGNENVDCMRVDLSELKSVEEFAAKYIGEYGSVYALINNAGVSPAHYGITPEGFENIFATNYLGHFLLTQRLLPVMDEKGRVINVTSDMHNPPGGLEWNGVEYIARPDGDTRKNYYYSKLCLIYFTHKLSEKLKADGSGITVNSFNPGFMAATNFAGGRAGKKRELHVRFSMPERYGKLKNSSDALAKIAARAEFDGVTGEYFDRSTKTTRSSELSYNAENSEELWQKSLEYCGLENG